ncbi:MAG: ECF-type sigma factor [Acidobacteriota bacterium]
MTTSSPSEVSGLLAKVRQGDREALERIVPLVYAELRRIAARHLRGERREHTLQPTALVHEAYVRMVGESAPVWQNRAHFLGCAAQLMRHILVDHARAGKARKRGGGQAMVTLSDDVDRAADPEVDVTVLDEALEALAALDARQARVVELKFFGGLSIEETAEVLSVSSAVVRSDWTVARAWLKRELRRRMR